MKRSSSRRVPVGAEVEPAGGAHFRVWAPKPADIALVIEPRTDDCRHVALDREGDGYYSTYVADIGAGTRYQYAVDGTLLADPASRFQPDGPFGPSEVADPGRFAWSDSAWRGVELPGQIVYEMHVGTFTPEGTWTAAMDRLPCLARIGISLLEIMPVAEFPGRFGWGYDGVFPYAPTQLYGTPDELRAFIDRAHALNIGVILDVVYNHLGPDGCVFASYASSYFSDRYDNEWGDPLNFDGRDSAPVREFFASNAAYWIDEYHFDGLRLDATQSLHDASREHIVATVSRSAREAAGPRRIVLIAENEPQHVRMVRPIASGGYGLDGLWNDDFHHSGVVALTGRAEAYYTDHRGTPQELISAARHGYLFQGQWYSWQRQPRGTPTRGIAPATFVNFLENHDQLANSGDGSRLHARVSPGRYRAMTALLLLMPGTPMLFQGQEFGASSPFLYFADHKPELSTSVTKGRAEFLSQFRSLAAPEMQSRLAVPNETTTFARCKLDWREMETHAAAWRLHRDLIALRRSDTAFRAQAPGAVDGAVLALEAFVLRFSASNPQDERLLIVNLGPDLIARSFAEPLMAPPEGREWRVRWSSEHPDYGGAGTPDDICHAGWKIAGQSAIVFEPVPQTNESGHTHGGTRSHTG